MGNGLKRSCHGQKNNESRTDTNRGRAYFVLCLSGARVCATKVSSSSCFLCCLVSLGAVIRLSLPAAATSWFSTEPL